MEDDTEVNWYSNDMATFGDRVSAAREARGLDQKTLARHLGVAAKTVEGWENDVSEPRANKLQMLSGVLNVSIPWLLMGEGETFELDEASTQDHAEMMAELRALRVKMLNTSERLGVLEKRLKKSAA